MKEKTREFRPLICRVLKGEKKRGAVAVYFAENETMRELNRRFRKIDRATDVLSFEMEEAGDLGEIVINREDASDAKRLGVHGGLHLLKYDHQNKKDREIMRKKEEHYLV